MKIKPSTILLVPFTFSSIVVLFLISLMLLFAAPARADQRDVWVENGTPWSIRRIQFRPSWRAYWDNDSLQDDQILRSGNSVLVQFSGSTSTCVYDFMVTFHQDTSVRPEWTNIDLCETNKMRIWYNSKTEKYMLSRT